MTREQQLTAIIEYSQAVLKNDQSGHSMDHIERVVKMAERIAATEACDRFFVLAGAYLHDVTDDKLVASEAEARQALGNFLKEISLSQADIATLFYIIDNVSFSSSIGKEQVPLTIEAQIVQDADRLDAVGAIGIGRTFYYGGYAGHKMYDPELPPRAITSKEEYRVNETVINHFYEKLLLLPDLMHTRLARELAKKRQDVMLAFLTAFKQEWRGE